jgi:hypothetical protein
MLNSLAAIRAMSPAVRCGSALNSSPLGQHRRLAAPAGVEIDPRAREQFGSQLMSCDFRADFAES